MASPFVGTMKDIDRAGCDVDLACGAHGHVLTLLTARMAPGVTLTRVMERALCPACGAPMMCTIASRSARRVLPGFPGQAPRPR